MFNHCRSYVNQLVAGEGDCSSGMPLPVTGTAVVGQVAVETPSLEFTFVGRRSFVAQQGRGLDIDQHVIVAFLEIVDCT